MALSDLTNDLMKPGVPCLDCHCAKAKEGKDMPYIAQPFRKSPVVVVTPGELSYAISQLLVQYMEGHKDFQHMNDIVGVLTTLSGEFQRRIMFPYEDKKIILNGDVFPDSLLR
jgi:hypothetical protein